MPETTSPAFHDLRLFTGEPQHERFCRMDAYQPVARMSAAATPRPWPVGDPLPLPATFAHESGEADLERALADSDTAALLVIHRGEIRLERYWLTGGPHVPWLSMSVAKSFVSALVGIAVARGEIASIEDAISDYIRVLSGSAYDGVRIRDVLQMSSGARWNEDYADKTSDVFRLGAVLEGGADLEEVTATAVRELEPGTVCRYNSGDTQALALLLRAATGRGVAEYMQEALVEPLGFESDGFWCVDRSGVESAFANLNLTARDFARLGELYRLGGRVDGRQVVPQEWVRASTSASAPHLVPGAVHEGDHVSDDYGYGYQWWLPAGDDGEFTAIGVYNQFVYVDPSREVVVVKLSANRRYGTSNDEADNREGEALQILRALARAAAGR